MSLSDRILEPFERLVKAFTAKAAYAVPWEYSVSEATTTTFTGRATSPDCPHPDLVGIPLMPGIAGTLIKPAVGSLLGVMFLNGDPTKPRCVSWDQTAAEFVGLAGATQDGSIGKPVHRVGDAGTAGAIVVGPLPPPAVGVALVWTMPNGEVYTITLVGSLSGSVVGPGAAGTVNVSTKATEGSEKVSSG